MTTYSRWFCAAPLVMVSIFVTLVSKPVLAKDKAKAKKSTTTVPGTGGRDGIYIASISYRDSYRDHPERGEHINIKVTPPEMARNGRPGEVLIEVYNYSNYSITGGNLSLELQTTNGFSQVLAELDLVSDDPKDLKHQFDARDSKIYPFKIGNSRLARVIGVSVKRKELYSAGATAISLPLYIDIIK